MTTRRSARSTRSRALLLVAVVVPSCLASACDGILGIPSDEDLAADAALDGRPTGRFDSGPGSSDATIDGPTGTDATPGAEASAEAGGEDGGSGDGGNGHDASDGGDASHDGDASDGGDSGLVDASCDPTAAFAAGMPIAELNGSGLDQGSVRLSADEQMISFTRFNRASNSFDVYTAIRDAGGTFGTPMLIGGVNTTDQEYSANLSDDLLSIVFERQLDDPEADSNIYYAQRSHAADPFNTPLPLAGPAESSYTAQPFARGALTTVTYVQADNNMRIEVFEGVSSGDVTGTYASLALLMATLTAPGKNAPVLSADQAWVYYSDNAADGGSNLDMYVQQIGGGSPQPLAALNTAHDERCGWISLDSCRLYYDSDAVHPGGPRYLYVASRPHTP